MTTESLGQQKKRVWSSHRSINAHFHFLSMAKRMKEILPEIGLFWVFHLSGQHGMVMSGPQLQQHLSNTDVKTDPFGAICCFTVVNMEVKKGD